MQSSVETFIALEIQKLIMLCIQTPAVFWIVNANNIIVNNHAVAGRRYLHYLYSLNTSHSHINSFYRRYGIWYRAEISATGTSANTPAVNPINVAVLESSGNVAHSNGEHIFIYLVHQSGIGNQSTF
jgi:hypothetical protein